MHSKSLIAFALYIAGIQQALAAPVNTNDEVVQDLAVRTTPAKSTHKTISHQTTSTQNTSGTKSNPIKGTMEVNDNNALAFDADCYAILCGGVEPTFRRDGDESTNNRKDAGAKKTWPNGNGHGPFRNTKLADVMTPGANYNSPEEFPFASTMEGGHGAFLFPVDQGAQSSQGGAINSFYSKHKIASGTSKSYFEITGWSGKLGPYCKALQAAGGKPKPSDSICKKGNTAGKGTWGFDVGDYAYKYDGHSYRAAGKNK